MKIKQQTKTFEEKVSKLSKRTRDNINASRHSFEKFCREYYDGRKADEIFEELCLHKGSDQVEALRNVLQNWIDWQYENGSLTSGIQQYLSKIKRVFSHHGIRIHTETVTPHAFNVTFHAIFKGRGLGKGTFPSILNS